MNLPPDTVTLTTLRTTCTLNTNKIAQLATTYCLEEGSEQVANVAHKA
jgi:hypothetical protein